MIIIDYNNGFICLMMVKIRLYLVILDLQCLAVKIKTKNKRLPSVIK